MRTIGLLLTVLFVLPVFTGCQTVPDTVTPRVLRGVDARLREPGRRELLLYVSKRIELVRIERHVNPIRSEAAIESRLITNRIILRPGTDGGLQYINIYGPLLVGFEPGDNDPRLTFVQNRGRGDDNRFYLNWVHMDDVGGVWQTDQTTGRRVIEYRNVLYEIENDTNLLIDPVTKRRFVRYGTDSRGNDLYYTVSYTGEEPYLRYRLIERRETRTRYMTGGAR